MNPHHRGPDDERDGPPRPGRDAGRVRRPDQSLALEVHGCAFRRWDVPRTFPVVHRRGPATLRMIEVDRDAERVLVCDGAHPGQHMWPTGQMAPILPADGDASGPRDNL